MCYFSLGLNCRIRFCVNVSIIYSRFGLGEFSSSVAGTKHSHPCLGGGRGEMKHGKNQQVYFYCTLTVFAQTHF